MRIRYNWTTLDASESAFLSTQFEQLRNRVFEIEYPEFKGRRLIPVDAETDPAATVITSTIMDRVGAFKLISNYADDLPRSDLFGRKVQTEVRSAGGSYGWNLMEVRIGRRNGTDLPAQKQISARQAWEKLVDDLAALGDTDVGLYGLLNQPNAQLYVVPDGAGVGADSTWETKTFDEMLDDLFGMEDQSISVTKGIESPDTLLLPNAKLNILKRTRSGVGDNASVLQTFLDSSASIKNIESWERCVAAGSGGTDRMVAYRRDPTRLQLIIPQEFEMLPPQERNLEFVVPCHGRVGGVVAYRPLGIIYGDGI
jgi:hypothetical protein